MLRAPGVLVIEVRPEVLEALESGDAVVGLESTVVAHGLPSPSNLEAAERMETAVREAGAVPAAIGVLEGRAIVGLSADELSLLAGDDQVSKVSTRDLPAVLASGGLGATTVAATAFLSSRVGIEVMATGGMGGVHRGGELSLDISADLAEIARSPVAVVCSGAKSILDLPRTLEALETVGVTVVGYRTDEFPGFYAAESGLRLEHRVETAEEAARVIATRRELGLRGGVLLCNPPPQEFALAPAEVEALVESALREAERRGLRGKALTPALLEYLGQASSGRTLSANLALLEDNARVAADVAAASAQERYRSSRRTRELDLDLEDQ